MGVVEELRQQCHGRLKVHRVDGLDHAVNVTARHRKSDRRHRRSPSLNASRIGSTGGQDLHLEWNLLLSGEVSHCPHHLRVGDARTVMDFDRHSFSESGDLFVISGSRNVAGEGHVDGDATVGFNPVRSGHRSAQSHLFLSGGHSVNGNIFITEAFDRFDKCVDGNSVVEALAGATAPVGFEVLLESDRITDLDLLASFIGGQADVHEELRNRRHLLTIFRCHDMNRLAANHPGDLLSVTGVHQYALGDQGLRIETSQRRQAQKTVVIDVLDDEADLVEVTRQHYFGAARLAFLDRNTVADTVDFDSIDEGFDLATEDGSDVVFKTGGTVGLAQFFQKFQGILISG